MCVVEVRTFLAGPHKLKGCFEGQDLVLRLRLVLRVGLGQGRGQKVSC